MPDPYIAILDDDPGMCRALRRLLLSYSYEVAIFHRGSDFLASLASRKPDLAILDVELPDCNGLEIFDIARQRYPSLPAVVITAWEDDSVREGALRKGASAFFLKPFDDGGFMRAIAEAI